jgi:hypothetical protein
MVELEAGNALSCWSDGGLRELSQLAAINKGFQNVLLNVEVIIVYRIRRERISRSCTI